MTRLRRGKSCARAFVARRAFRNDQALFGNLAVKPFMLRRIEVIDPAAQHGDSPGLQACRMRFAVNAEGEAGHDGEPCAA